ncbi:MAG: DUF131 domain-containing protein [Candidatus Aenigmarchaeota archaeon]|nr:DUF131 domain-containing protein [Candidatus Aenigmarchaeota archaeon]
MRDLISAGLLLVFIGIILMVASMIYEGFKRREVKVEGGGVVFIGPIPIVFGTNEKMVYVSIVIALMILIYILISMRL